MKRIDLIVGALLIAIIIMCPINVAARDLENDSSVYYDTEDGRYIKDLDQYLFMLNSEMIVPYAPSVEGVSCDHSMNFSISEPTKKCSNIFGHKWSSWGNWTVTKTVHTTNRICVVYMERNRYCTRTYCGAWQKETDVAFIDHCNH